MIVLMLPNNTYNNNNIYLSDGKEKQDDSFSSEGKVQIQEDIDFIWRENNRVKVEGKLYFETSYCCILLVMWMMYIKKLTITQRIEQREFLDWKKWFYL